MKNIKSKLTLSYALVIATCTCLAAAQVVNAESLWQDRTSEQADLFRDSKARCVGDQLTVFITESSDLNSNENRDLQKSTDTNGEFELESAAGGGFKAQAANALMKLTNKSGRKFKGGATFNSNQAINDRITATVIDVLPNGNLVVSGQRSSRVGGDVRNMVVSGVVRAIDIAADNSVQSRDLGDLRLEYQTVGPNSRFSNQGTIGRWTNALWPF